MPRAFAKPAFDIGFATNDIDGYTSFWSDDIGLAYDHLAKLGGGFHQHRWMQGDSIIKVNHTRTPLPDMPLAGYRGVMLAAGREAELRTPDGIPVSLVVDAQTDLTLQVTANDLDAFNCFYGDLLGLTPDGPNAFRLGRSRIVAQAGEVPEAPGWREKGLRYMTVQIFDCDGLTAEMERHGAVIGAEPRTIGQVRYSFVRDPDGNWIELSERASLTGKPVPQG